MYLAPVQTYYKGSEQCVQRAPFLLLLQVSGVRFDSSNTYAIVRKVALRQFGHFMMGRANLGGRYVSVSGSYGHDGLPLTVETLPRDALPLPIELYQAWNTGGGWNGAGSEAPAMRQWANSTFKERP